MASSRTRKLRLALSFALALLPISGIGATVDRADDFVRGLALAKSLDRPLLVLIHGSSWSPAQEQMLRSVWQNTELTRRISFPIVITDIPIRQNETDDARREKEKAGREGWVQAPIKTYPAVQIYGSEGRLLATLQGRRLLAAKGVDQLASLLNPYLKAATERTALLETLRRALDADDPSKALNILQQLIRSPLNREDGLDEWLRLADPEDKSGWRQRLQFDGWQYTRESTQRLNDGQAEQVLAESQKALASGVHPPEQRIFLLATRGRALLALARYEEAWQSFRSISKEGIDSPEARALFKYGLRVAGFSSRDIVDPASPLAGKNIGENLTRKRATFQLSSQAHDDGSQHDSLFYGPLSPTGFAFHTGDESGAHLIIDLDGPCLLKALRIANRSNLYERAEGLTVWASKDRRNWKRIWRAHETKEFWHILLENPEEAAYLKIGLPEDKKNFLHLRAIDGYGKRL